MKIRFAELNIDFRNRYDFALPYFKEFAAEFDKADIVVFVSEKEIDEEIAISEGPCPRGYAEFICGYRQIALQLHRFNAFVFHAAVIECDGCSYAFAAPSGTGKSTHIRLWQQKFGNRVRIINGDKPVFRLTDKGYIACGTPWRGKENLGVNATSPLHALCFLERAKENCIRRISDSEAVMRLFSQVLLPADPFAVDKFLSLLDAMVRKVPCYLLGCNMDIEAAEVAYRGMNKGENK